MFDGKVRISRSYGSSRRDNGSQNRSDVLERARNEREARALEKKRRQAAVGIQALARRALSNIKCKIVLRKEFDTSTNNIKKMSTLLKSAGKTFIVPSAVMLKLLRTFILFFDLRTDAARMDMIMSVYLKYIAEEENKAGLYKAEARGSWMYLFGRLYEVSFRLLRESAEHKSCEDGKGLANDVIRSIPLISDILSSGLNEGSSIMAMAPLFIVETCGCLRSSLQLGEEGTAGTVMAVLVGILKWVPIVPLFQQLTSSPRDQEHPWARVMWAIARDVLSIENLTARTSAHDLGRILCAEEGLGWRVCLHLLLHRLGTGTEERSLKQNALANYLAQVEQEVGNVEKVYEVLWPSTLSLNCMESSSFAWLGLVDQVLLPHDASTNSTSLNSILRVLVNSELIACSLRRSLLSSSMDMGTAVMSLYGRLLLWHAHDVDVTQVILSTRFLYRELNDRLWGYLRQMLNLQVSTNGEAIFRSGLDTLYGNGGTNAHSRIMYCVLFFCQSLYHELRIMDDEDFLASGCVVGEAEMASLISLLNATLLRFYRLALTKDTAAVYLSSPTPPTDLREAVHFHATRLYNHVFKVDDRRHFFQDARIWQWTSISEQDLVLGTSSGGSSRDSVLPPPQEEGNVDQMDVEGGEGDGHDSPAHRSPLRNPVTWEALQAHPQVVPFKKRVGMFQRLLEDDKSKVQGDAFAGWSRGVRINVDRSDVVQCAWTELNDLDSEVLKGRLQVQFISKQGYHEAGIDGGGLFKEFMDDLISHLFGLEQGLFVSTGENLLMPNPAAHDAGHLALFKFAGKMLGKALYESLLVDPQFSGLFLNVLLGRSNQFDDLAFLDQELYANMKKLKHMGMRGDDVGALDLYFEAQRTGAVPGDMAPLPGGSDLMVTNTNYMVYVFEFANFRLNTEFKKASKYFNDGLHAIIPKEWIRLFSPSELQQVIGGQKRGIDIEDMMKHTNYAGGYAQSQPYIQAFWRIVSEMGVEQQGNLLKFITSCSRQPLRGFAELSHQICIQKVPQYTEDQFRDATTPNSISARLPSAATCVNLLKLPEYDSADALREKLLYAITNNNTGFELS